VASFLLMGGGGGEGLRVVKSGGDRGRDCIPRPLPPELREEEGKKKDRAPSKRKEKGC